MGNKQEEKAAGLRAAAVQGGGGPGCREGSGWVLGNISSQEDQ